MLYMCTTKHKKYQSPDRIKHRYTVLLKCKPQATHTLSNVYLEYLSIYTKLYVVSNTHKKNVNHIKICLTLLKLLYVYDSQCTAHLAQKNVSIIVGIIYTILLLTLCPVQNGIMY